MDVGLYTHRCKQKRYHHLLVDNVFCEKTCHHLGFLFFFGGGAFGVLRGPLRLPLDVPAWVWGPKARGTNGYRSRAPLPHRKALPKQNPPGTLPVLQARVEARPRRGLQKTETPYGGGIRSVASIPTPPGADGDGGWGLKNRDTAALSQNGEGA